MILNCFIYSFFIFFSDLKILKKKEYWTFDNIHRQWCQACIKIIGSLIYLIDKHTVKRTHTHAHTQTIIHKCTHALKHTHRKIKHIKRKKNITICMIFFQINVFSYELLTSKHNMYARLYKYQRHISVWWNMTSVVFTKLEMAFIESLQSTFLNLSCYEDVCVWTAVQFICGNGT